MEDFLQNFWFYWLWNDLVYLVSPGLLDVFLLDVASACDYHWLHNSVLPVVVAHLVCKLKAVHDGHTNVSQDESVNVRALLKAFLNFIQGFQAIIRPINDRCQAFDVHFTQVELHAQHIVGLVVNDQNAFDSWNASVDLFTLLFPILFRL